MTDTSFPAGAPLGLWHGGKVSALATCVLAPNPSPMTLEGTNTWVLGHGASDCVVVDPGPDDDQHHEAVLREIGDRHVATVLLTHGHPDHAGGARVLAEATGASIRALDPAQRLGSEGLVDGDVLATGEIEVRVIATPGHTADSLCFALDGPGEATAILTGDTVLGRGPSLVAYPDGRLGAYLDSLDRLTLVCSTVTRLLPGHGPVVEDPLGALAAYRAHRLERLAQVAAAMRGGARTAAQIVEVVYADVAQALWPAAEASVRAQLEYLRGLSA